jgi:hypothetical protein
VEKLAPENQRRKGGGRQKMRHQERTVFDVEEGSLAAVARLPESVHI